MHHTDAKTLLPEIRNTVEAGALVHSDEAAVYNGLDGMGYWYDTVPHSKGVYVRAKDIHTNTIEGFWSQLKRSIDGSYHHVTTPYLQLYVDEYAFRYSPPER